MFCINTISRSWALVISFANTLNVKCSDQATGNQSKTLNRNSFCPKQTPVASTNECGQVRCPSHSLYRVSKLFLSFSELTHNPRCLWHSLLWDPEEVAELPLLRLNPLLISSSLMIQSELGLQSRPHLTGFCFRPSNRNHSPPLVRPSLWSRVCALGLANPTKVCFIHCKQQYLRFSYECLRTWPSMIYSKTKRDCWNTFLVLPFSLHINA